MCRLVKDRLSHVHQEDIKLQLRVDIWAIQLSHNRDIFEASCRLFFEKHADKGSEVDEFLAYFKKNWVDDKAGWYEGYSPSDPSQSNSIESQHCRMKAFDNIKTRTPAITFVKEHLLYK